MPSPSPFLRRAARAVAAAEAGSVSAGGALVLALALIPMTAGVLDGARYVNAHLGLEDALHGAMLSALATDGDVAAVQTSVAESGVPGVSVEVEEACLCPTSPSPVACGSTCPPVIPGGQEVDPVRHLKVVVSRAYKPIFAYPSVPDAVTLRSEAVIEVNGQ